MTMTIDEPQADWLANILGGMITPYVAAIFIQKKWPKQYKVVAAMLVSLALAAFKLYLMGKLQSVGDLIKSASMIFGVGQVTFGHVAPHFGLEAVEKATELRASQETVTVSQSQLDAMVEAAVKQRLSQNAGEGEEEG